VTTGKYARTTLPAPLERARTIELIRLAQSPLARALIAIAYYASTPDSEVAEAVWSP